MSTQEMPPRPLPLDPCGLVREQPGSIIKKTQPERTSLKHPYPLLCHMVRRPGTWLGFPKGPSLNPFGGKLPC